MKKLHLLMLILLIASLSIGQNRVYPPVRVNNLYCFDSASTIGLIQTDIFWKGCSRELVVCDSVVAQKDTAINSLLTENEAYKNMRKNDSISLRRQRETIVLQNDDIDALKSTINQQAGAIKKSGWKGFLIGLAVGIPTGGLAATAAYLLIKR